MSWRVEHLSDRVTLYCGDCREIIPTLHLADVAVVSNPPYGIGHRRGRSKDRGKGAARGADCRSWDSETFDPSQLVAIGPCVLWGANFYADSLPASRWLLWDKQCNGGAGDFSEFEIAWCSEGIAIKAFRHMWLGVQRDSEVGQRRLHPTQKPVALMDWSIRQLKRQQLIFDPYMGSGTTGVAAVKLGRGFVGIEIEPDYFEIARRRISDALKQPDLFVAPDAPSEQRGLDL